MWNVPEAGQNCAWHVGRTVRKPLRFEPSEDRGEREECGPGGLQWLW